MGMSFQNLDELEPLVQRVLPKEVSFQYLRTARCPMFEIDVNLKCQILAHDMIHQSHAMCFQGFLCT